LSETEVGPLFAAFLSRVQRLGPVGVSLVEAFDEEALSALEAAQSLGFVSPYLVGDEARIRKVMSGAGLSLRGAVFVPAGTPEESARVGVSLVREGTCKVLMKGKIGTATLLKAALDRETGLRSGRILSHVAALEVPGFDRFVFVTDGGVVLKPDLDKKVQIAKNAIEVCRVMGVENPRIAVLAPSEAPNPDSEASVHASALARLAEDGAFPGAFLEGPMALDAAISPEAAAIKAIGGEVAGRADVLLAPDVVCGNSIAKSMQYFAHAVMGGIIVGATAPIVVISRADTHVVKLNSLAMARCLIS
jgi:phosphate butyryltransferase